MTADAPPDRFAVQRAADRKWETVAVHETEAAGSAAFLAAVQASPRTFLRLIRLRADTQARGEIYDWTLVRLHDPRRDKVPAARTAGRRKAPPAGPVRAPVRLYVLLFLSGALLVLLWMLLGGRPR